MTPASFALDLTYNQETLTVDHAGQVRHPDGRVRQHPEVALVMGTPEQAATVGFLLAAAPKLARELLYLVRLLEPLERDGTLDVPGLASLNGARRALCEAEWTP